ncbi:3'-5' exonuclease [Hydrogenivirga sp. 128-5-R1-1]|uniref:3'-5' exonuclease n=1 Tax=Hydrogenivirga sp. 128-5-R1-1 TaxID=392423 RepID=UPI00015EF90B|nr:3'-5' exonuclease [Hydrogenivirga sp. 128-5-R1-1]EDP75130.1 hypothetical protein HG1285_00160 [Hydrogenivirga sp. 128-5-R1-1]
MNLYLNIKKSCLLRRYGSNPNFGRFFRDVNLKQKVEETTFVVFDTETTGLDLRRAELVSIGALRVVNYSFNLSESFHRFVKPKELTRVSVEIHGITPHELEKKAESHDRVLEDFMEYVRGSVLVGFNVEFDRKIVEKYSLKVLGLPLLNYRLDVFRLWKKRGGREGSLKDIAEELGIPVVGAHSALDDAYITALVFLKLLKRFRGANLSSLPLML